MIPESDLELGQFRLLDVDNRLIIPVDCNIRLIVTGADVLHSFAVPSLGLKLDAVPGRLNQVSFVAERPGIFYGQCSEICGVWHGFMPIVVEAVPSPDFLVWIESFSQNLTPPHSLVGSLSLGKLITVKYSKDRGEPIKLSEPKIPVHFSPWFVVGLCEAEACFDTTIQKSETTKSGFSVNIRFRLSCHKRDIVLLHMIKTYLNCGIISKIDLKDCLEYSVSDQNSISNIIIPFFNKYPLRGTKLLDYLDWVNCFEIVKNKEHLTSKGLNKIRQIKISLNTGRVFNNDALGSTNTLLSQNKPGFVSLDPNYISGFLVGDGYLSLISKIESPSLG